ncbi:hypothetical protein [Pseudomonas sp. CFBP 13602]|uniref:hypothetical protein n=1 Tax=Pseudomonas sp. CFBP 13602 TaxID=2774039 RepID=UPI00177C9225|nr:hypothetical protein [Pseudomonas sp. CFBP 13602]MBD8824971.1 hypothetical protein [Pseudomonas sp. CFBP 13602]
MKPLPHPLFASARIFDDCEFSGYSPVNASALYFSNKLEAVLQPTETHELANSSHGRKIGAGRL